MKKLLNSNSRRFVSLFLSLIMTFAVFATFPVSASSSLQESNWLKNGVLTYPVTSSDPAWSNMTYFEQLDSCNLPDELLYECSTSELADLFLQYPFLIDVLAFDRAYLAIEHFVSSSNIFEELLSRDDCTEVLLEKYDKLSVNYEGLVVTSNKVAVSDSRYDAELFLQTYFAQCYDSLQDSQITKLSEILGKKHAEKDGICDDFSTSLMIYEHIQKENGFVPSALISQELRDDLLTDSESDTAYIVLQSNEPMATSTGFTSSGNYVQFSTGAIYAVGTYTKYGVSADCYKYYSGDYTSAEKKAYNNQFDAEHPSWTRRYSCTKKYNCHSYTWINSSSSNVYWLNNPNFFAGSDSFTLKGYGHNATPTTGDKIKIEACIAFDDGFGNVTYALHSANVISSSGLTRSKLGNLGVYDIPIDELVRFYDGFFYCIYT